MGKDKTRSIVEQNKIEVLISALKLECMGIKMLPHTLKRGSMTASQICRVDYGLKGSRQKILEQMEAIL